MSPPPDSAPRALLYLTTEVDPAIESDFGAWSEAHARDNLAIPGFLSARRLRKHSAYHGVGGGPKYLTFYELREADVLDSDAYANRDSSMPAAFSGRFQFTRSLFRALDPPGSGSASPARGASILHVTVDVDAAHEEEFLEWYVGAHVPAVISAPGMLGAQRYVRTAGGEADDSPATGKTAEKEIRFLTLYEMEDPGVVTRPETLRASSEEGACPDWLAPHRRAANQVYDEIFSAVAGS